MTIKAIKEKCKDYKINGKVKEILDKCNIKTVTEGIDGGLHNG